jgi:hypothetical protein
MSSTTKTMKTTTVTTSQTVGSPKKKSTGKTVVDDGNDNAPYA